MDRTSVLQRTAAGGSGPGCWLRSVVASWDACGRDVGRMARVQCLAMPGLLPTVFQFNPDSLLMLVDVRGFEPSSVKVEALGNGVMIRVNQSETCDDGKGTTSATRNIERMYELPRPVRGEEMLATVRDATLYLSVPWQLEQVHCPWTTIV